MSGVGRSVRRGGRRISGGRGGRAWLRYGFTTRASCLFAAGVTAIVCGLALGEINLLRAGVLAAVVPWVAAIAVARTKVRISVRRSVTPEHVAAGSSVTASITISNGSPLPTAPMLLEDRLPDRLAGHARFVMPSLWLRESRTVAYRIPALGRGRYRIGPLQVRLGDPFGLIELSRAFTATDEIVVAPAVDVLGDAGLPRAGDPDGATVGQGLGIQGADDASTREYRVGDDLRKIHWRSTARTGSIMVRQEEQLWQRRAAVLLDLRAGAHRQSGEPAPELDPRDASSLEWAVSAAASVGVGALRSGRRFVLADDAGARRSGTFTDSAALLSHLAEVRAQHHASPLPLMAQLRADEEAEATIAILGAVDADTLGRLLAAGPRGRQSAPYALVLDVDTWEPAGAAPPRERAAVPAATVAGALYNAGWHATVVRSGDRTTEVWHVLAGRGAARQVGMTR